MAGPKYLGLHLISTTAFVACEGNLFIGSIVCAAGLLPLATSYQELKSLTKASYCSCLEIYYLDTSFIA
jgi:hypothetical protein